LNPTGVAYYDGSLPTSEKFANSFDIYVANINTVYSAVYKTGQTYLVTVNFNANTVVYKKALALLQTDWMRLTRIQLGGSTGWFY
jgi:hypothetical protein